MTSFSHKQECSFVKFCIGNTNRNFKIKYKAHTFAPLAPSPHVWSSMTIFLCFIFLLFYV